MKRMGTAILVLAMGVGFGLGGCSTAGKVKRTLALNDLHIRAAVAEDEGDWDEAYALWSEYVDRRPQSALAEYRLGQVEMQLGLYRDAVGHLRVAHDLQPGNVEYIEALAGALVASGDQDALMDLMRRTAEEGPDGSGYLRMGRYAQQAGLLDEANEAFQLAIVQARGTSPEPYIAMADFARAIDNTDLEVRNLRYALWFDRTNQAINTRLQGLGMIPGPSLALTPEF
ncbi:MAG: tetratricopeptide repeat protein [Phycisphaerales bacterium JB052]